MNHIRLLTVLWAFWLVMGSACQLPNQGTGKAKVSSLKSESQILAEKIRHKTPYTGPIQLQIASDWFGSQASYQSIDVSKLLEKQGFQTLAVPDGELVFQKTFIKTKDNAEFTEAIQIADTTTRYTLHVQKYSSQPDNKAIINMNGFDWITESDFKQGVQEVEKASLLLNARNSLRIKLQGKTGTSITVSLVKGGQAATILRRRGKLGSLKDRQEGRVRHNDTNIFDPNDLDSLGGLKPYQGDQVVTVPGITDSIQVAGSKVNGTDSLMFENGSVILNFADSTTGLQVFRDHYGATVQQELDGFYKLKLDLSTSPVLNLTELIRKYNQRIEGNIEGLQFSSLAAMQTWAIVFDAVERFPGLIRSLELNLLAPSPSVEPVQFSDTDYLVGDPRFRLQEGGRDIKNWVMEQSKMYQAWNYSIGTGTTVAFLDNGFNIDHPEIKDRLVFGKENFQSEPASKYA